MDKFLDTPALESLVDLMRTNKQSIVFTNGCFDLLHPGHIDYLQKAKTLGDVLIVALNSDDSVRQIKGESRPVNSLNDRIAMLAALECVDFVTSFQEDTPYNLIDAIKPDILVKGGDYTKDEIVGADIVEDNGGELKILDFLPGYSSSDLIKRIQKLNE
ncbi:MAG: D-glycero-beta-D-manno-heptose 1-phosphate adenylyltransferase [Saprospiraceae bacterium]